MRWLVTFSFIMYAVCFYWRAYTFEPGMDFGASARPQFIVVCGGLFFMPLTTITLSGLPPERLAAASSLSTLRERWRVYRRVDNHDHVDQPRVTAPCTVD